jgi:hypothetical protein
MAHRRSNSVGTRELIKSTIDSWIPHVYDYGGRNSSKGAFNALKVAIEKTLSSFAKIPEGHVSEKPEQLKQKDDLLCDVIVKLDEVAHFLPGLLKDKNNESSSTHYLLTLVFAACGQEQHEHLLMEYDNEQLSPTAMCAREMDRIQAEAEKRKRTENINIQAAELQEQLRHLSPQDQQMQMVRWIAEQKNTCSRAASKDRAFANRK